ncbi:Uncharacterised protein [Pseudomonas fluorescens]|uniref:Uncharacterized protein n=1 Tax=Pseudomonas fluorescens TaxID=294 RepID=A0A3S4P1C3_PSEFL|nr:hypothetical protein [Pseudomonas fluorescens]VEF11219.1 Uncharacterised protein [Pseudomonas fluorescens]
MSAIHDQAMNYVYQQVLQRLMSFFSRAERTALQLLIHRVVVAAGGMERIGDFKVMVVQSGARDSFYSLALLRAAQLSLAGRAPATFQLRVASLRWNANDASTLQNLHRSYSSLFLYDDPRVELVMVDNREVLPFDAQAPVKEESVAANRFNLLMIAHRRGFSEKLELWDDAYIATAGLYSQVARWNHGVDALIGSEPPRRQKHFLDGLNRALQKAGVGGLPCNSGTFEELFGLLDRQDGDFYREFHSEDELTPWRPEGKFEACRRTSYVDIHDMVVGNLEERWPLLSDFLGFQPGDLVQQYSESEYADPLVGAYLEGLHASFIEGRTYEAGVRDFLQRNLELMQHRQVPESVREQWLATFGSGADLNHSQQQAREALQLGFAMDETQVICLLFAPFVNGGAGLERFLRSCHPGMLVALPDLHRAMQGLHAPEQVLKWMTDVSGMPVRLIARLYAMGAMQLQAPDSPEMQAGGCAIGNGRSAEG